MAITRIKTGTSSFVQPALEGTVTIIADPGIDWLRPDAFVHIPGGGIYEIVSISVYAVLLRLKTLEAPQGSTVTASVIYPVNHNADNQYSWGAKEW